MKSERRPSGVWLLALLLAGCALPHPLGPREDAAGEAQANADALEEPTEAGDALAEASPDALDASAPEPAPEAGPDAPLDAPLEAEASVDAEAGRDAPSDAPLDAPPDVRDGGPDVPEVGPDVPVDAPPANWCPTAVTVRGTNSSSDIDFRTDGYPGGCSDDLTSQCPGGTAAVGFAIEYDNNSRHLVRRLYLACQNPNASMAVRWTTTPPDPALAELCPPGYGLSGFTWRSGAVLDALGGLCTPMPCLSGSPPPVSLPQLGGNSGSPTTSRNASCPGGQFLTKVDYHKQDYSYCTADAVLSRVQGYCAAVN